jgi:LemA protein
MKMNRKWLVPGIIGGVILILIVSVIGGYNGLVDQREGVNSKFAALQGQYQRRADLVPNLVNTVKGAANFEQDTLTQVTEARSKATSITIDPSKATPEQLAQYQSTQGELSQALGRLLAVSESYPELTATQNFRDLQTQLEGTENRIAVARKDYNDAAATYNAHIKRFPTNVTAGIFGFDAFSYFQADAGAEDAPKVDFGN